MDSSGNTLVIGNKYTITSDNDKKYETKNSGIYTYKGKPYWSQGYRHEFIKDDDGTKLLIPVSTLTGSTVYAIKLLTKGGRRKIRKQTRKTRARRLNRRKHTRKH